MQNTEMKLHEKFWQRAAKSDPMYYILADPNLQGNKWDIDAFMESGVYEVDTYIMPMLEKYGLPRYRIQAIDYGCGLGRITQALCKYFQYSDGFDISGIMLEKAKNINKYPDNCCYDYSDHLGNRPNDRTDFIWSCLVFQHISTRAAIYSLKELLRVLAINGLAIIQTPINIRNIESYENDMKSTSITRDAIETDDVLTFDMYAHPHEQIEEVVKASNCHIIDRIPANRCGDLYEDYFYVITKGL